MNKSNLILASTLAIIFTSILIIFSPNSQKLSLSSPAPSPVPTESISPTPNPTADWKTYENEEYGFSFQYPSQYISEYESSREDTNWYLQTIHSSDYRHSTEGMAVTYGTAYFHVGIENKKCLPPTQANSKVTVNKIDIFSNLNIQLFEIHDPFAGQYTTRTAHISQGENSCIQITCLSLEGDCVDNKLGKEFNQILSTFKFTP